MLPAGVAWRSSEVLQQRLRQKGPLVARARLSTALCGQGHSATLQPQLRDLLTDSNRICLSSTYGLLLKRTEASPVPCLAISGRQRRGLSCCQPFQRHRGATGRRRTAMVPGPPAAATAEGAAGDTGAAADGTATPGTYYYLATTEAAQRLLSGEHLFAVACASVSWACFLQRVDHFARPASVAACRRHTQVRS